MRGGFSQSGHVGQTRFSEIRQLKYLHISVSQNNNKFQILVRIVSEIRCCSVKLKYADI